jgi:hypothetical protein
MIVSEEHPACRHGVFRVMHALGSLIRCKGRHEVSIRWGGWISVNHCEKVVAYFCAIARPDKQVVTLNRSSRLRGVAPAIGCAESNDEQDLYALD